MTSISIHKQLQELRKKKGQTQEELAEIFGVTNQAVSKWESGACFPDTALLPAIADYYGVSIDSLFDRKQATNNERVVKDIKAMFHEAPAEERFTLACHIAFYLHEGIVSNGYKGYLPWDPDKSHDQKTWGTSICSEPEGVTVAKQGMLFFSDLTDQWELSPDDLLSLWGEIQKFADVDRLTVFFALYELTRQNYDWFVPMESIVKKAELDEKTVREAFNHLPIHHKRLDDGSMGYRIEASHMHLPPLLTLFVGIR
jgi:transcriptional regulator with XRE-family HTH domain